MLRDIPRHLDELLDHARVADYPGAMNGLQLENSGRLARLCAAVGACEALRVEVRTIRSHSSKLCHFDEGKASAVIGLFSIFTKLCTRSRKR